MQQEFETVIANTTCFILLDKISELNLLHKLFGSVTTTTVIAEEFGRPIPNWVIVKAVENLHQQETLELEIDPGEASAIALAFETQPALLILDDSKARKMAERLHLNYSGTLGILLKAKQSGIISAIKPILQKVQSTNFRYSGKVFQQIIELADE